MTRFAKSLIPAGAIIGLLMLPALVAADAILSGFTYDGADGEALIGCNVALVEIEAGTITNGSGLFVLPGLPPGTYTLVASHVGYRRLEPAAVQLQEMVVAGDAGKRTSGLSVSTHRLEAAHLSRLPRVVEVDLLRSLQSLPGIVPVSDFSSAPHVRGGTPDQNLYLIDGTDVYNPEHAFGLFSVFNMDAIKDVQLYKGGFGAPYGGRLSSVLDVTHLDGNRERFEGTTAVSLLSARTTLQYPLGRIDSVSGSVRRTHFDQTVARVIDVPEYYFYDSHLKVFVELDRSNKLTLSGYGGRDVLDLTFNDKATEALDFRYRWGNSTGSARWTTLLSPRLFANLWLTGSRFDSQFDLSETLDLKERNDVQDVTIKGSFEYVPAKGLNLDFGFEQKHLHVVYQQDFTDSRADIDRSVVHRAGYAQVRAIPGPRWMLEGGLRGNFFASDRRRTDLAPRAAARYRVSTTQTLKVAAGQYYQYLHRIPRMFIADIWTVANRFQPPSRAVHFVVGLQQKVTPDTRLELEAYRKTYRSIYAFDLNFLVNVTPDRHQDGVPIYEETRGLFHRGRGSTSGVDFMLERRRGAISGWAAYTLSRTRYRFDQVNRGVSFAPRHDVTSTVNMVGSIDLGRIVGPAVAGSKSRSRWTLGFNFVYSTGQPLTRPGSGYVANSLPDAQGSRDYIRSETRTFAVMPETVNGSRLPAYVRLDLGLRYRRERTTLFVDLFNAGNRRNVWFLNYDDDSGGFVIVQDVNEVGMFPLLPSVGIEVEL